MQEKLFQEIFEKFELGDLRESQIVPFGEGLIHDTFLIQTASQSYVLQGFNNSVFQYPDRIASNLAFLSAYQDSHPFPFLLPLPLLDKSGSNLVHTQGKMYRLFDFVEGKTIQEIDNPQQAFLASEAYGQFAAWAKDVQIDRYQETIPHFHRLDLRYEKFLEEAGKAINLDEEEKQILLFYTNQKPLIEAYREFAQQLPLRLTHSDTKINNLIFSKDLERVAALIDLDTLMPGYLMYDFGDLVRTVACSVQETSTSWDQIHLDLEVFQELLSGYWSGIKDIATPEEKESLLLAGEVMTCMMGLRFFTDHLMGNVYYKVKYPEQNLHRAKNQMIYLRDQQAKRAALQELLDKI